MPVSSYRRSECRLRRRERGAAAATTAATATATAAVDSAAALCVAVAAASLKLGLGSHKESTRSNALRRSALAAANVPQCTCRSAFAEECMPQQCTRCAHTPPRRARGAERSRGWPTAPLQECENALLRFYYKKPVLFVACAGTEFWYVLPERT